MLDDNIEGYTILVSIADVWWAGTAFYAWWGRHSDALDSLATAWSASTTHVLRRTSYKGKKDVAAQLEVSTAMTNVVLNLTTKV